MRERGWMCPIITVLAVAVASCGGGGESGSSDQSTAPASESVGGVADSAVSPTTGITTTTAMPETTTTTSSMPASTTTEEPTTTEPETTSTQSPRTKKKNPAKSALAELDEIDVTVYRRLAESVLASSAYSGMTPEELVAAGQAPCRVLLAGGDLREAIAASIAASPAAGQPFGAEEQTLALLLVTRGAVLWCPDVIDDEEAFKTEVIATIVDVFFEG